MLSREWSLHLWSLETSCTLQTLWWSSPNRIDSKEQIVTDLTEFLPPEINNRSYKVYYRDVLVGPQIIIRFPNNYGASIIKFEGYFGGQFISLFESIGKGMVELAVIEFYGPGDDDWELCYDTPITSDITSYLNKEKCIEILNNIGNLPPKEKS